MTIQYNNDDSFEVLGLSMNSSFDIAEIKKDADTVTITEKETGKYFEAKVRIDTEKEWEYFVSDGILNYVLKKLAN